MACGDCTTCTTSCGAAPGLDDLAVRATATRATRATRKTPQRALRKNGVAGNWAAERLWTESEVLQDAGRCLFCVNAPCQTGCPARVNVKHFVHAAAERSWYAAAKTILSANPLGASTAWLCPACHLCRANCSLATSAAGAINTNQIQRYVMDTFRRFGIRPTLAPNTPARTQRVAVVGAGPAGLAAAVFLRRMGYPVDVFDGAARAGGLLTAELPVYRLPKGTIEWEIEMAQDLGVQFHFGKELGKHITVESLKTDGYSAVFVAVGKTQTIEAPFALPAVGSAAAAAVVAARTFCRAVNDATRHELPGAALPDLAGKRVIVLGAGDTAVDCAQSALRCGAAQVTIAFRKAMKEMRADWERVSEAIAEGIELMPLAAPADLITEGEGEETALKGVRFDMQLCRLDGSYASTGAAVEVPADYVIVAFGSAVPRGAAAELAIENATNVAEKLLVDADNFAVLLGGDVSKVSTTVVEAVNDGRSAAAGIHAFLAAEPSFVTADLPDFHCPVDDVDLTVEFQNNKWTNPFSISSAPISLAYDNIARCYDAGFGGALTKTMCLTKDVRFENSVRILKAPDMGPADTSYANCCMISEHALEDWEAWIRELRAKYPTKGLVLSIMCEDSQEDWEEITRRVLDAARLPDIGLFNVSIECNLSCPNQCAGENGFQDGGEMAMALGVNPKAVERIARWVVAACEGTGVPVFIKLTPNVTRIEDIAEAAARGGAFISTINTVSGLPAILLDGRPYPTIGEHGRSLFSMGCSGDQVRPVALADIAKCAAATGGQTILGIGGVRSAYTAIQHIQAGATAVQICSAVQKYSYEIVSECIDGLKFILYAYASPRLRAWMSCEGPARLVPGADLAWESRPALLDGPVPTVKDRVGVTVNHLVERDELPYPKQWFVQSSIDEDACIRCGACATSCRDNSIAAIRLLPDGRYVVSEDCIGCALCASQCPVGAMSMVRQVYNDQH